MFEVKTENINQISVEGDQYETTVKLYNCIGTPLRIVFQTSTAETLSENLNAYFHGKRAKEKVKTEQERYKEHLSTHYGKT